MIVKIYHIKIFVLFFCILFSASILLAQEKYSHQFGISAAAEIENQGNGQVAPNLGFFLETKFTPKSGLELGIFSRTYRTEFFVTFPTEFGSYGEYIYVREEYFTIPVLYRFSAKFASFSIGPNLDIFSGWTQIRKNEVSLDSYQKSPQIVIGPLLKIGKEFKVKGGLILEPEIRFGRRSFYDEGYVGLGLKMKQEVKLRSTKE